MDNQKRTENAIDRAEAMTKMLAENVKSDEEDIYIKVSAVVQLLRELSSVNSQHSGDLISREKTLTAFADYVGSGMSMDDYDALWDIVAKMPAVKQEPRFIAKFDGTIEQIKECTEQEPCGNAIDRAEAIRIASGYCHPANVAKELAKLPSVNPQPCENAISRKAVHVLIHELEEALVYEKNYISRERDTTTIIEDILALPPVTPQPKIGHWIEKDGFDGDTYYDCSECGESWTTIVGTPWDNGMAYCPNCGCRMVEPQERSDKE